MNRKQKEKEKERREIFKHSSCGKKQKYESPHEALQAGKTVNFYNRTDIEFKAYLCRFCNKYHLTGT